MTNTTVLSIPVGKLRPNPWQPRQTLDPAALAELADSIKAHGLLQPPVVRSSPRHPGTYELAFGHRRLEAWKLAHPRQDFPCKLSDLSDRQMAEHAATENAHRQDLNPVERARGLKRLIGEFQMTQAEAGKLYGLATQGAVSNVVRLLELPDKVLDLVAAGQLSEKEARKLIGLGRLDRAACEQIAAAWAKDRPSAEQAGRMAMDLDDRIEDWVRKHGKLISGNLFPYDWLPAEQDIRVTEQGETFTAPKCEGCPFLWKAPYVNYCLRPKCHAAKDAVYVAEQAAADAKKLGIALAAPGESVHVFYRGNWNEHDAARPIIAKQGADLRLVPHRSGYPLQALATRYAVLGSTDPAVADKFKAKLAEHDRRYSSNGSRDPAKAAAEKAKREQEERHIKAMVETALPVLADALPDDDGLLEFIWFAAPNGWNSPHWGKAKRAERKRMLLEAVLSEELEMGWLKESRELLLTTAKQLKAKLPKGWDAAPPDPQPAANGKAAKKTKAKK